MTASERDLLERDVRARCEAGDPDGGATLAIKGYGPEVYGFLVALHKSEQDAADVFAVVCENVWRGLPGFAWGCSLRTWLYTVARNAALRHRKDAGRRAKGAVPLSEHASVLAAQVRTQTQSFLRTETRDRFAELRESLPPEDRMLLVLRVDRDLAWSDLARVMLEQEDEPDEATLKRETARLRKRFQLVKEKLVELGRKEGLIGARKE